MGLSTSRSALSSKKSMEGEQGVPTLGRWTFRPRRSCQSQLAQHELAGCGCVVGRNLLRAGFSTLRSNDAAAACHAVYLLGPHGGGTQEEHDVCVWSGCKELRRQRAKERVCCPYKLHRIILEHCELLYQAWQSAMHSHLDYARSVTQMLAACPFLGSCFLAL